MSPQKVETLPDRKKTSNKFIVGIAAFLTTGIITASGFAGAATMPNNNQSNDNDKDKSASSASISAQQDQHSEQTANTSTGGTGYGGNTSVTANVNLAINNSHNNIIQVIFQIFE